MVSRVRTAAPKSVPFSFQLNGISSPGFDAVSYLRDGAETGCPRKRQALGGTPPVRFHKSRGMDFEVAAHHHAHQISAYVHQCEQ